MLFLPLLFLASSVNAADLGEQVDFNVDSEYDVDDRSQLMASLRVIGEHIYFYVEDDYWNSLNTVNRNILRNVLRELADEFDNVIYPKERAAFGSEWNPGIDNDKRITVLVSRLVSKAGGYFNVYDEYPKSSIPSSNQREMFYLNVSSVLSVDSKAYIAHEFQHLISFYQKTILYGLTEEVWLNEARSEYAPTLCGYNNVYAKSYLADRVDGFLDSPSDSLTEWKNELADYGAVSLFLHYLVGQYGTGILTKMTLNDKVGIASIEQALTDSGYQESFADIFAGWQIANYLNDCQLEPKDKYCYTDKNLTYERLHTDYSASYSGFPSLIVSRSSSVKDWSGRWYQFRQGTPQSTDRDMLKLDFSGLDGRSDFSVPYVVSGPNNETTISYISLNNQEGVVYVPNFSSLAKSVVIIPFNQYKKSGFNNSNSELSTAFSFTASSVEMEEVELPPEKPEPEKIYPDGSLLRAVGDYKVYIIKGGYKRWIQTAELFNMYGHLKWEDVIEVSSVQLAGYKESYLIRVFSDKRVYEMDASGIKHWLNMTAEQFNLSGRDWGAVYMVNDFERDYYETGSDVRE